MRRNSISIFLTIIGAILLSAIVPQQANAQWQQTSGPYGGGIKVFAVEGTNLFVGTNAGVFVSSDNGDSWTSRCAGLPGADMDAIAVIGTNVFVGSADAAQNGGGIFLSSDDGATWTAVNSGLNQFNYVTAFAVNGSTLFAGIGGGAGVYASTDNGTSWTQTALNDQPVRSLFFTGTSLLAGTDQSGLHRSTDNGATWTASTGIPTNDVEWTFVAVGARLFAATNSGVHVSDDDGVTWVQSGLPNFKTVVLSLAVDGSNVYAGTDANDGSAAGNGVFLSTDNGATWTKVNSGLPPSTPVFSMGVSGGAVFAGTDGSGVYRSTDNGTSWTAENNGLASTLVLTLAANTTDLFAGAAFGGVFHSTDNGVNWAAANTGMTNTYVQSILMNGSNLFAATYHENDSRVFLSTDNGTSWMNKSSGLTTGPPSSLGMSGSDIFVSIQPEGVFRSIDNGDNWTEVLSGLSTYLPIPIVSTSTNAGTNLYTAQAQNFYSSTDNGDTWTTTSTPDNQIIMCLATLPDGTGPIFAGTPGTGVLRSTDNGGTWSSVGPWGSGPRILSLAVLGTNVFIGTERGGLWQSTDNGDTWVEPDQGMGASHDIIRSLTIRGTDLFVGVFRADLGSGAASQAASSIHSGPSGSRTYTLKPTIVSESVTPVRQALTTPGGTHEAGVWRRPLSQMVSSRIMASAGAHGSVSPAGMVSVPFGEDTSFNVIPDSAYEVYDVLIDGDSVGPVTSYTFHLVTANHTISALFRPTSPTVIALQGQNGWNMVSVPLVVSDYHTHNLFPTAVSNAFSYNGGYVVDSILHNGGGYWVKFPSAAPDTFTGRTIDQETVDVRTSWNMIGSIGKTLSVASIVQAPPNSVNSSFFGYDHAYFLADSLEPGQAYWVKVRNNGKLILSAPHVAGATPSAAMAALTVQASNQADKLNVLEFDSPAIKKGRQLHLYFGGEGNDKINLDAFELPPVPFQGSLDARFASNRTIALFDNVKGPQEIPLLIQTDGTAMKLSWTMRERTGMEYTLIQKKGTTVISSTRLIGNGSIAIDENGNGIHYFLRAEELPSVYSLYQNYPNPFNPTTKLRFDLPEQSEVTLKIYDVLGREVARLLGNQQMDAGQQQVEFRASDFTSGIYFYRIEAQSTAGAKKSYTQVKKMMLIK